MNNSRFFRNFFVVLALMLFGYLVFPKYCKTYLCKSIDSTYTVDANSEIIELVAQNMLNKRFAVYGAKLSSIDTELDTNFNGTVSITDSTNIKFTRRANNALSIEIERSDNLYVAHLYDSSNKKLLSQPEFLEIYIDSLDEKLKKGYQHIFPISGLAQIGKMVESIKYKEIPANLKKGEFTMQVLTSDENTYTTLSTTKLLSGDELKFNTNYTSKRPGQGLIMVNNEIGGLDITYRIKAHEAIIVKSGPKSENNYGYITSTTHFDKFINNRIVESLTILLSLLLILTTIATFIYDTISFFTNSQKKDNE